MEESELKEKIKQAFLAAFTSLKEEDFRFDMPGDDIEEWDSLSHMNLISELEQRLGVSMEIDEISEMDSVENVLRVLKKKTGGS